jgi:hypothetical protein
VLFTPGKYRSALDLMPFEKRKDAILTLRKLPSIRALTARDFRLNAFGNCVCLR